MYLKRLEIQGFKSFAKRTVLEFEPGITAVVGPNGSGKSNVADCLRWVLGEQSAKLMRGKKSEDVIFVGSDKRGKMSLAEVAATFDNRDHKIPVDAAEVSIGRRVDRSGESEYLINGNVVRLLDVIDLVLKSNIGTSRYTIIGQGTIDQIILSGPSEIKNLIDEASGVKVYYLKREKTLRRLEQTAQNLMRAEDLLSELEPRVKSLRRQAKRMEARAEVEADLRASQVIWFSHSYQELDKKITEQKIELAGQQQQRHKIEQSINGRRNELEASAKSRQTQAREIKGLQDQQAVIQTEKNLLLENLSLIRGKMQSQKTSGVDAATLEINKRGLENQISELEQRIAQDSEALANGQKQTVALEAALDEIDRKIAALQARLASPQLIDDASIQGEVSQLEQALESFWQKAQTAGTVSELLGGIESFRHSFRSFKKKLSDLLGQNPKVASDPRSELDNFQRQRIALGEQLSALALKNSQSGLSREFLARQLAEQKQQLLQIDLDLKKAGSATAGEFVQKLLAEEKIRQEKIDEVQKRLAVVEQQLAALIDQAQGQQKGMTQTEQLLRQDEDALNKVRDQETAVQVEAAKLDTQLQGLVAEAQSALRQGWEAIKNPPGPGAQDLAEVQQKIIRLQRQLELIGGVDELTIQEYHETEQRYIVLQAQVNDLNKGMQDLRSVMDELDEHIKVTFNEAFHKINEKFEYYFRLLFNGGRAYLSLLRAAETKPPEEAALEQAEAEEQAGEQLRPEQKIVAKYEQGSSVTGVDIKATPPGKKLSSIQALSGGERALTSIALLCSMLACFPSPFVVLDEVDAALDEANTMRFGQILATLAHQTQFITITHNRETMSQANALYGVTMGDDGVSQLLGIKLEQARVYAK